MSETLESSSQASSNQPAQERRKRLGERRLLEFFKQNPTEELTTLDVIVKFDMAPKTAGIYLGTLAGAGLLERVSVYRLKVQR